MNELSLTSTIPDAAGLLSGQYWGELRIFAEVARAKSFNKAAERLRMSQPTIARKVRRLQDLIGAQLFIATKHGVKLTQRGDELACALVAFDHSLFSIARDLKARDRDAEGIVRVSITDGMAAFFAAPAVPAFSARHPKIQLHIRGMSAFSDLRENQTDMMLTMAPAQRPDIICKRLGTLHFVPVAARGYVAAHGMPTRETIGAHAFVQSHLYQSGAPVYRGWQEVSARGRTAHFCDSSFAYGMMVKQGIGIGLLGSYTIRERSLMLVDLGIHAPVQMYAVALRERMESRPVALVFDWLCATFGEANRWFGHDLCLDDLPDTLPAIDLLLVD